MLPTWLIKKIDKKKVKETFIQEELRIEEYPLIQEKDIAHKKEEVEERGVIIIDMF